MQGNPASFNIGDKVKIYVPPTQAQLIMTGRKAKHVTAWRGPCTITAKLSPTAYSMSEDISNREFERTIVNIRPFRASRQPPAPHHDPLSQEPLTPGTLIAIRDSPESNFRIARVTTVARATIDMHFLGTTTRDIKTAKFKNVYTHNNRVHVTNRQPSRHHLPFTATVDTVNLPEVLLSNTIKLTAAGNLDRHSKRSLAHLQDEMFVHN